MQHKVNKVGCSKCRPMAIAQPQLYHRDVDQQQEKWYLVRKREGCDTQWCENGAQAPPHSHHRTRKHAQEGMVEPLRSE